MAETGTYLYAVSGESGRPEPAVLDALTGVAGTPVRAVAHGGLVAYVSTVPLEEFGEEPLRRSLEDLDWVGATARAHHHVVETVAATAATAPVRLVTVYSGEDKIREMLDRRHDDLVAVLSRVAGRREWGVKAYTPRVAEPAAAGAAGRDEGEAGRGASGGGRGAPSGEPGAREGGGASGGAASGVRAEDGASGRGGVGPGTAYLQRRKNSLRDRDSAWRISAERAEQLHAALAAVAVDSRRHRPQDPQLSGRDDLMLLNGAYLVDDDRREEFAATLEALSEPGIVIELTGPWAPYSFAAPDAPAHERGDRDGG
ncbi:GvpL/GvpF family gas vesicle protein [Sphaerisporangium sp. TRM90804]|uniref:GvpL/GvpF family gas vesicle protein n=1 Tax=Sphaerisporangium sp. TRM90804 TaxID=3031113 RepID=UPI0024496312|nr:GvpL/GvpF family gas vesicle protein [Sphaerisporangium sp. TRM90804]MDH2430163.1 GvpL/GvpF family gas vesicle protein [Sphaerisporangium sp. TRM90804]